MANTAGSKHTTGAAKTQTPVPNKGGGKATTRGSKHTAESGATRPPIHKMPMDRGTNMSEGSDNMGHHPNGEHSSDAGPMKEC
jgi:hypothetical protein